MRVPTRSDGTRSGVNCTRANVPPSTPAVVLIVSVFARPGHALDQEVALREQADEHALEHRVLPGDDPADLEQRLLEAIPGIGGGDGGNGHGEVLLHRWPLNVSRSS